MLACTVAIKQFCVWYLLSYHVNNNNKISEYSGDPLDCRYFFQRVGVLIQQYSSILFFHEIFPAEEEINTQPFHTSFSFFLVFDPGDLYYLELKK